MGEEFKNGIVLTGKVIACFLLSIVGLALIPVDVLLTVCLVLGFILIDAICYTFYKGQWIAPQTPVMPITEYILSTIFSIAWSMLSGGKVELPSLFPKRKKEKNGGTTGTEKPSPPKRKRGELSDEVKAEICACKDRIIKESVDAGIALMPYPYLFEISVHAYTEIKGDIVLLHKALTYLDRALGGTGEKVEEFDDTVFLKITDPLAIQIEHAISGKRNRKA